MPSEQEIEAAIEAIAETYGPAVDRRAPYAVVMCRASAVAALKAAEKVRFAAELSEVEGRIRRFFETGGRSDA